MVYETLRRVSQDLFDAEQHSLGAWFQMVEGKYIQKTMSDGNENKQVILDSKSTSNISILSD